MKNMHFTVYFSLKLFNFKFLSTNIILFTDILWLHGYVLLQGY